MNNHNLLALLAGVILATGFAAPAYASWAHVAPASAPAQAGPTPTPTPAEEPAGQQPEPDMALVSPPPALSAREQGIAEVPCELGMPDGPGEIEGESYYCGIFTVPMRWDDVESPNLDLHYMVLKATGDDPAPDPLVYLAGGPGQSSIVTSADTYRQLRQTRDIVRLDQRGAGLSQRLGLEECLVLAAQDEEAAGAVAAVVQYIQQSAEQSDQEPSSAGSNLEFDTQVRQLCAHEFTQQGIDLDAFTTTASARDLVELIQALGYDAFNVHGVSYGTRLAMMVMALLPSLDDAPALRSVVLDSTLPPSVYLLSSFPRDRHDPVMQLLQECEQDEACRTAYPNLAFRLGVLLERLAVEPLRADGQTIDAAALVQVLTRLTGTRAGYMPLMIAELEQDVTVTYLALLNNEVGTEDAEGAASFDMSDPVQAFLADSITVLGEGGEMGPVLEFLVSTATLLAGDDALPALQSFIDESYEGATRTKLTELLATVTPDDVAKSSYVAQLRAGQEAATPVELTPEEEAAQQVSNQRMLTLIGAAYFLNMNIHCNEDFQFERYEDALNAVNDLAFPQFTDLASLREQSNTCVGWPVAAAPIEVKNPVSSTVPALILQGAYDTRTPLFMGRRAARELANSTLVVVPQQGHEVWTSATNCAGRIATAFVLDPGAELDLSCLDARRPQWALPEGE